MNFVDRITSESHKLILNPYLLRLGTDDRVKRAAEGVREAFYKVGKKYGVI